MALLLSLVLFLLSGLLPNGWKTPDQAFRLGSNILRLAVFLGVIAAGQTLVIISGGEGIDLSAGAVVTMAAVFTFTITNNQPERVLPALLVALAMGAVVGLVNGVGVAILHISPLVMTLGMAGVVDGLIIALTRGVTSGGTSDVINKLINSTALLGLPGAIWFWILFGLGMWLLLERTGYGKYLFSIGVNRTTARLSGVNVPGMVIITFLLAGMLAAFGGFLVVNYTRLVMLNLGEPYLFPSIAAVAVGGTLLSGGKGSYWGSMAGAILLTLITSLLTTMQLPQAVKQMVLGGTLLLVISIYGRQRGLRQ
jgi:ribose transport system permease protein